MVLEQRYEMLSRAFASESWLAKSVEVVSICGTEEGGKWWRVGVESEELHRVP